MKKLSILAVLTFALATFAVAGGDKKVYADASEVLKSAAKMAEKMKAKGWIGLKFDATEDGRYAVSEVIANSPAQEAGFQKGDVFLAVNGVEVSKSNKEGWAKLEKDMVIGAKVVCAVVRGDYKKKIKVTLGQMPEDMIATYVGYHVLNSQTQSEAVAKN